MMMATFDVYVHDARVDQAVLSAMYMLNIWTSVGLSKTACLLVRIIKESQRQRLATGPAM